MGSWLVTGGAGFVGAHVCRRLLAEGHAVVAVDSLNDYYDPGLKQARLEQLVAPAADDRGSFRFLRLDVADRRAVLALFAELRPSHVVHLAAQAGVRHSLSVPSDYVQANLVGFANVLEACQVLGDQGRQPAHLVYASSSSVYGGDARLPFDAHDTYAAAHPVSLYAATKRANELMAHAYSHLYKLPATGLRFFTVYGPYGRPDMAYWKFAEAIWEGREIVIYGDGSALRDFTYIDDVVESLVRVADSPPVADADFDPRRPDPATSGAPWRVCNIGFGGQATVEELVELLEDALGKRARRRYADAVPGDVPATHADTSDLTELTGYIPQVALRDGIARFTAWYEAWRADRDGDFRG